MTNRELEPRIRTSAFMKGFLASLAVRGEACVITQANRHQTRFGAVVEALDDSAITNSALRERLPILTPSPVTGEYAEFDEALISFQALGLTRCVGPYFNMVELDIAPSRAEHILTRFSVPEQEALGRLADVYRKAA